VGAPWRDVPERYGPWQAIYGLFRRCQREKVWALAWSTLLAWADARGLIRWDVSVDSTINRAHQHAAHRRHQPRGRRQRRRVRGDPDPTGVGAVRRPGVVGAQSLSW
jgi:transposase